MSDLSMLESVIPDEPRAPDPRGRIYVVAPGGRTAAGGIARMVDYLMAAWNDYLRAPKMVCIDTTGPDITRPGFKRQQPLWFARALRDLWRAGRAGDIALMHVHMAERGSVLRKIIVLRLGKRFARPVILHVHAAEFVPFWDTLPAPGKWLVRRNLRLADRFVVLGSRDRAFFIEKVGLDPERIVVLHNAVPDPEPVRPPMGPVCKLFFAGVLIERKGLRDLLEALAPLHNLAWALDVAGNGDTAPWVALAADLGLADRVKFLGWLDSKGVHARLDACDVMVLPSHNEGLPMIILEALAHGRPVLATNVGSVNDAVINGDTGLLVPPHDPARLREALDLLIRSADLRARLGVSARRWYQKRFTIRNYITQLGLLYDSVLPPLPVVEDPNLAKLAHWR